VDLCPVTGVDVVLPNGDQFDLDLLFCVDGRLIWVEAKTSDDFSRHLPKYRQISSLLCDSEADAVLLWTRFDGNDPLLATRGSLARMTLCGPGDFPDYVARLVESSEVSEPS